MIISNPDCGQIQSECISYNQVLSIERKEIKNYNLFPNPVDEKLHIHLDKVYNEIKIKLFDVTGKTFDNKEFKNKSKKISVDVSRLTGQFIFLISLDGVEQKKDKYYHSVASTDFLQFFTISYNSSLF